MANEKTEKVIITKNTFVKGKLMVPNKDKKPETLDADDARAVVSAGKGVYAGGEAKKGLKPGQPIGGE